MVRQRHPRLDAASQGRVYSAVQSPIQRPVVKIESAEIRFDPTGTVTLYAGTSQPGGEAVGIMVPPIGSGLEHWHASKLRGEDDERIF